MNVDELDASIVDWVIEHPHAIAVFEEYGIDYCCAGKSLRYACERSGIDPEEVVDRILGAPSSKRMDGPKP